MIPNVDTISQDIWQQEEDHYRKFSRLFVTKCGGGAAGSDLD